MHAAARPLHVTLHALAKHAELLGRWCAWRKIAQAALDARRLQAHIIAWSHLFTFVHPEG